jgi:putative transposase
MSRKTLQRSDRLPYHVTARANNREEFHLYGPKLWDIVKSECWTASLIYGIEFHAVVLMPNHFHMIATVPEADLGVVMESLMTNIAKKLNLLSGRSGHVFGGPYFWSLISSSRYFGHVLKYVYRNPVRAELCDQTENHPFSTLPGIVGDSHLPFPIHFTRSLFEAGLPLESSTEFLTWLNTPFPMEAEKLIKMGLRRKIFEKVIDRGKRRSDQLTDLI